MGNSEHDDAVFRDAVKGLRNGDFSRLEPCFLGDSGIPKIIEWHKEGRFHDEPTAVAEALTAACFLGHIAVAEYLLQQGVDPAGGAATGMNALHWAANRGQLESVRLLLRWHAPLETLNMYEGTALGTATWSLVHEPRGNQLQVIEALLEAGASLSNVEFPTGNAEADALLRRYRAQD